MEKYTFLHLKICVSSFEFMQLYKIFKMYNIKYAIKIITGEEEK